MAGIAQPQEVPNNNAEERLPMRASTGTTALETPVLRPIIWMGDSKRNLRDFPEGAQKLLGDELQLVQFGGMPRDAKPFKGVGSGVLEIALRYASDAYRVVLAVQIGRRIYVLHAFQKKSKKGTETPKHDVDLIKKRYTQAQELAHENEKRKTN
jgi:phage-related protein